MLSQVEIERTKLEGEKLIVHEKELAVQKMLATIQETEERAAAYKLELQDAQSRLEDANRARNDAIFKAKDLELQLLTQKSVASVEFEITALKR
jgi:maltodextrin utilization protein YvdJ